MFIYILSPSLPPKFIIDICKVVFPFPADRRNAPRKTSKIKRGHSLIIYLFLVMSTSSCNGRNCHQSTQNYVSPIIIRSPFNSRMHKFQKPMSSTNDHSESHNPQPSQQPQQPLQQRRRICPQGEPMITMSGDAVTCNIHDPHPCPHDDYVCNINQAGEAYCCPDPSKLFFQSGLNSC